MTTSRGSFFISGAAIVVIIIAPLVALAAWSEPSQGPTGGNPDAPINTGTQNQNKNGGLSVTSFAVFGSTALNGNTYLKTGVTGSIYRYLNFGADYDVNGNVIASTIGESGYGIRDKDGALEFKNSGGTWQSIQAILWELCGGPCGGGESSDGRIGSFISETTVTNTGGNKTQNIAIPSNAAVMELTTTCNYTQYAGTGSWVKYNMGDGGGDRWGCYGVSSTNLSIINTKVVPLIRGATTLTISSHVDHYDGFAQADVTVRFHEP